MAFSLPATRSAASRSPSPCYLHAAQVKALLPHLLDLSGEHSRLVTSTPLWIWPQPQQSAEDLEEHLIAVPAQPLLGLNPAMFHIHIHSRYLPGTFAFSRRSLPMIDRFVPTADRGFGLDVGRATLESLARAADDVLYFVA